MATWAEARPWVIPGGILTLLLMLPVALGKSRGLRLNNPGNLERSGPWTTWEGLAPDQPDPRFAKFVDVPYGIELLGQVLLNKQLRKKLLTTRAIVYDYAPKSDGNKSDEYAAHVAKALQVTPDQVINLVNSRDQHIAFVEAVMFEENSIKYPKDVVLKAVSKARSDLGVA